MAVKRPLHHTFFGPVTLWAEDLKSIIEIIGSISSEIEIESGGNSFSDFDDLRTKTGLARLTNLKIAGKSPYISFDGGSSNVSVFVGVDNEASRNASLQICDLIRDGLRKPQLLYDQFAPNLIIWSCMPLMFSGSTGLISIGFFYDFLAISWWIFTYVEYSHRHFVATAAYRYEVAVKSSNQNILALVIAIGSAVLGAVLSYLLPKLFH